MPFANHNATQPYCADQGPHEILALPGYAAASVGFGLALAAQTLAAAPSRDAAILWVRDAASIAETGEAYGPGLISFGVPPDRLIVAEMRTHADALRAGLEGARCPALAALILETASPVDLTASRRLKLAAEKFGVTAILIRPNSSCVTNSVPIRWCVREAPRTEKTVAVANTIFKAELLKHPKGLSGRSYILEWNHERHCFAEALSLSVAAVSSVRSLAA